LKGICHAVPRDFAPDPLRHTANDFKMNSGTVRGIVARWTRRCVLDPLLRLTISVEASLTDARFVRRQQLPADLSSRILFYPAVAIERLNRGLGDRRQDLLFDRYADLNLVHYGPSGRGYQAVAGSDSSERLRRYRGQSSRLEYFMDCFPELLNFNNGDSFLEFGCGTGQNIRVLAERFPASRITGFDLNQDAINLVRECEDHDGLVLTRGDITLEDSRRSALAGGVDHVVMCHTFSLLFGRSRLATEQLRLNILFDLVTAVRKTVVVIDTFSGVERPKIRIEQKQRGIVSDDLLRYFVKLQNGRAYTVHSDRSQAVVFVKDALGLPEI